MATITSTQSGNFSDAATWAGGVVPGASDDAVAATGHTVAIDVDVTVLSVTQAGTGKFTLGNGRTLTANVIVGDGTYTSGGTVEVTATTFATINGSVSGPSNTTNFVTGVVITGSGALTINGNITGAPGNATAGTAAVYSNQSCTLTVNGNVTGGTAFASSFKWGIFIAEGGETANVTVNGNCTGGTNIQARCLTVEGRSASITVTGNLSAGLSSVSFATHVINASGDFATINVTGNITNGIGNNSTCIVAAGFAPAINVIGNIDMLYGPSGASYGIQADGGAPTINVVGSVTGPPVGNLHAGILANGQNATVSITGDVTGGLGTNCHAISGAGGIKITTIGTISGSGTNSFGISAPNTTNAIIHTGNLISSSQGCVPVYSRTFRLGTPNSGTTQYANSDNFPNGPAILRISPDLDAGTPAAEDVRFNTSYGFNNELTGQLRIPPANAVSAGVAVDDTTGTAALRPEDLAALSGAQIAAALDSTP